MSDFIFDQFEDWFKNADPRPVCFGCAASLLKSLEVQHYPHAHGVTIRGGERVWAYVVCQKCGYQNSFKKLLSNYQKIKKGDA